MERKHPTKSENVHTSEMSSLSEKMRSHYRKDKSKDFHERVEAWAEYMVKLPLPIPFLVVTLLVGWYYGVTEVLPVLYGEYGPAVQYLQVLIGIFFTWQILVFWCGIRFVDSSFKASKIISSRLETKQTVISSVCVGNSTVKDKVESNGLISEFRSDSKGPAVVTNSVSGRVESLHGCRYENSRENGWITIRPTNSSVWVCNTNDMDSSESYWQTGYCFICDDVKPPRCHHCRICNVCILKRDHHCYFTGACVGWRNQRYFIIFCFWASLSCCYASVNLLYFIHATLWSSIKYSEMFAPFVILRCILGYTSLPVAVYVSLASTVLYFGLISTRFLLEQLFLVTKGRTSFENNCKNKDVQARDTRTVNDKMRSVFGNYWLLNWVIPTHFFFPPVEDPVNWSTIKTH